MIVTTAELVKYADLSVDDPDDLLLILSAAQERLENYLGYRLEAADYTSLFSGSSDDTLNLGIFPINSLSYLKIDGSEVDLDTIIISREHLILLNDLFPEGKYNIEVSFNAGHEADYIPDLLKLTVLRIAAVLASEGSGHIGVSSVSDGNTGSRTFMERSFSRYLREVSSYKASKW